MASVENHLAILDEAEAQFIPQLETSLSEAVVELIAGLRPRGRLRELSPTLERVVRDQLNALWEWTIRATNELSAEDLGLKADVAGQYLADYREEYGVRQLARILGSTREQVLNTILIGQRRGESLEEIAAAILDEAPKIGLRRAQVIARTEAHAASQYSSQRQALASGLQLRKQWNSIPDDRVRDFGLSGRVSDFNHRVMNGVRVSVDSRFAVPRLGGGAEMLLFPGDPDGSAGNIINCRCIQTYVRRA